MAVTPGIAIVEGLRLVNGAKKQSFSTGWEQSQKVTEITAKSSAIYAR